MNYLAIFIGGGIGSLLRYSTTILSNKVFGTIKYNSVAFPLGTFLSNIISSLILGLLAGYFLSKQVENVLLRNLLIVGICGGFSTFSTFAFENFNFIKENQFQLSIFYILASIFISLLAIYIGLSISKNIFTL